MNSNPIREAVYDTCAQILGAARDSLSPTTSFAEELEADSLDLIEIVMELETRFDIKVDESALAEVRTIADAEAVVGAHLEAAAR